MSIARFVRRPLAACLVGGVAGLSVFMVSSDAPAVSVAAAPEWRSDPAWYDGSAEWAVYDAVRPIYGQGRTYQATIFTNKQQMDPKTTTKASDWRAAGNVEVFKHNCSEIIPTENYDYRMLTTAFIRTKDLSPMKVVASTQEFCGTTYKEFTCDGRNVDANMFCYFPEGGKETASYRQSDTLAFHDGLSLTLRDYPFESSEKPTMKLSLVPDQTDTHETGLRPADATVSYVGRETLNLPYGAVEAHHLRVTHARDGGTTTSNYWFAADVSMRHVMVQYEGPYGVEYKLKKLGWWTYWDRSQRKPG